jgi:hypothetical protein
MLRNLRDFFVIFEAGARPDYVDFAHNLEKISFESRRIARPGLGGRGTGRARYQDWEMEAGPVPTLMDQPRAKNMYKEQMR